MKKRILALILCVLMVLPVFAGCAKTEAEKSKNADEEITETSIGNTESETMADPDKPYAGTVLRVVTVRDTRDTSTDETYGDKTALKMAEEATGIKIEWTVLDSSSAADKLPALLSSEDQPDLYLNVLDQATISQNQDMFYDMSKDGVLEKYAPNVVALYEPYDYFENVTWPDGAIYSLVTTEMFSPIEAWSFSNTIIRQDWLDQLGLPVPTTADELYQTLVAFRDNDMNGNGDATDEIPLSFASNYWQGELWLFAGAFGLHGATWQNFMHYKMLSEDGKVIPSCKTDNFREYIEFFHKLYDEGLMDAEGFSQTGEQYEAKIANNQVGVYPHYVWDPSYETSFTFEGFDGVQVKRDSFVDRAPSDIYKFGFVPTADANIEALLTWWNYLSQKDVALIAEGGNPENSFWEWTEDGNAQRKAVEKEVDGETTVTPMAPEDWMVADIVNGYPAIAPDWWVENPAVTYEVGSRDAVTRTEEYINTLPTRQFSRRIVSDEMTSARAEIELELFDYIERFIAESIVYGLDDAKWEAHLQQLTDLGYDEWIQWYQDVEDGNVY